MNETKPANRKTYLAIDLKSFYASVECHDLDGKRDALTTNLVVADESRTEKTICLAVSPALRSLGVPGRPRLFEVIEKVKEINERRLKLAPNQAFTGTSDDITELNKDPSLELTFIIAKPRMQKYMDVSSRIYNIYLRYIAHEDMHIYSVDEVFLDVTDYLNTYQMTAHELAIKMIREVLSETGITATAGIGTNLYLCKVAMDIVAKRMPADKDGVRIAELDEMSYRRTLWNHTPLTDFWRVGRGYTKKLAEKQLYTMGDIARCSLGSEDDFYNEDLLYAMFGINAELLIDHAWGYEPCTIADIKSYVPESNSISQGQVLTTAYPFDKARIVIREMAELLSLDLFNKRLVTDQLVLNVGYDIENLSDPSRAAAYRGEVVIDRYGRRIPKGAHGSLNLRSFTASSSEIMNGTAKLFDEIVHPDLLVRRMYITAAHIVRADDATAAAPVVYEQLNLFSDFSDADINVSAAFGSLSSEQIKTDNTDKNTDSGVSSDNGNKKMLHSPEETALREQRLQEAVVDIKKKYGKNAVLRGMNFLDGATMKDRNRQIGGHKA